MDIYDVMIHLKCDQITNQMQSIDFPQKYAFVMKELDVKLNERMSTFDFDPIHQFVEQLRFSYSEFALFFDDRFGSREIGVLWKPYIFESRPFKISNK